MGILYGLCRTCRGIGGVAGVPLFRIDQAQTMVFCKSIVYADMVVMLYTVAAVPSLVAVGYALLLKRVVCLMLHLSVTSSVRKLVRRVYT